MVVDIDGDHVVDLWGGHRDEARTTPWDEHTITNVWSTTKTVTSLAALMLAGRGKPDVRARVASYLPELAANCKDIVLYRDQFSHGPRVSGLHQRAGVQPSY